MSHEEVVKGRTHSSRSLHVHPVQGGSQQNLLQHSHDPKHHAFPYHVFISRWEGSAYLTPCCSSTCSSTLFWSIRRNNQVNAQCSVQIQRHSPMAPSPKFSARAGFAQKCLGLFCAWKVACTDWKIWWVMFSEGREGKNRLRFVSLRFLQSWLCYKVMLL